MKTLRPPSQPRPAFAPGSPDRPPKAVGNRNAGWPRPYLRVSFQTGFRAGCQQVADRQEGLSCSGADRLQDEVGAETNDFFVPQRVSVLYFESERERPEAALFQVPNGNILRGAGERWRLSEPFLASELARSPVQEGGFALSDFSDRLEDSVSRQLPGTAGPILEQGKGKRWFWLKFF